MYCRARARVERVDGFENFLETCNPLPSVGPLLVSILLFIVSYPP